MWCCLGSRFRSPDDGARNGLLATPLGLAPSKHRPSGPLLLALTLTTVSLHHGRVGGLRSEDSSTRTWPRKHRVWHGDQRFPSHGDHSASSCLPSLTSALRLEFPTTSIAHKCPWTRMQSVGLSFGIGWSSLVAAALRERRSSIVRPWVARPDTGALADGQPAPPTRSKHVHNRTHR